MRNILVIRFGSLGDVILTSAAVLNLKVSFPESRVTYLTKARFGEVVQGFVGVDEVICLPEGAGSGELVRLLLDLDSRGFEAVVDLHGNPRSWLARKIITGQYQAVYPKRRLERQRLVRGRVRPVSWPHTIDLYNEAVRMIGGRTPADRPVLPWRESREVRPEVQQLVERHPVVVAIAPGAAHPPKQWPMERFVAVAEDLHRSRGVGIIWAVTGSERGKGIAGIRVVRESLVELVDCPIGELAEVLRQCTVTVANDSGVAHLSSAVGTPVAAVFGPTHPALGFAPRGWHDTVVEVDEYCRPCSLHGARACFREEQYCFTRIKAAQVVSAAAGLIDWVVRAKPALFVDRDGTVMVDKRYLGDPAGVELIPGSAEALRLAKARGYKVVIVSNQSGVARGMFGTEAVERVNGRLRELLEQEGVLVDGMYYCPHYAGGRMREFSQGCGCRKPSAGMVEQAARELGIDVRRSWVIGDKEDDMHLARVAGARGVLVRTGYGASVEERVRTFGGKGRVRVADNLAGAVQNVTGDEDDD